MIRILICTIAVLMMMLTAAGCMTPQERSGRNPKPFNSPASWELNPYGPNAFQN